MRDLSGKIGDIIDNCASNGYDLLRLDSKEKEAILGNSTGEFDHFYVLVLHALLEIYICEIDKSGFQGLWLNLQSLMDTVRSHAFDISNKF